MSRAASDHNLLFGILALQMDFVSRDQLVAALRAWVLAKHRSLGDILRDEHALSAHEAEVERGCVKGCAAANEFEGGGPPTPQNR